LADAIKKKLGIDAELIKGGGGNFIVIADGVQLFSKKEVGRFPQNSEILEKL
jgi:predicted Rdx family selenoprotein